MPAHIQKKEDGVAVSPSHNRVRTDIAALALQAGIAEIEGIEKGHERGDETAVFRNDAGFEITTVVALGTEAGTSEIGGADVGEAAIGDDALHVHSRTENTAKEIALDEIGKAIEVSAKTRTRFFGVDEADFHAFADFTCEDLEKRDELFPFADV